MTGPTPVGPHRVPDESLASHPFGGIVTRGVALAIDGAAAGALFAIATVAISLVLSALGVAEIGAKASIFSAGVVWVLFVITYFVICWTTTGQTVGMRLMGLRLVVRSGKPPSLCRSLLRYVFRFVSIILLFGGYVLMLLQPQRRTLHDLVAGTFVVYADAPPEAVAAALAAQHDHV